MPSYRKLTIPEIESLFGIKLSEAQTRYANVVRHVKTYYPAGAVRAVAQWTNEYDDNYYQCGIQYLAVYDAKGNEMLPIAAKARECRRQWPELSIPGVTDKEQGDPLDDLVIPLTEGWIPELFVKEGYDLL